MSNIEERVKKIIIEQLGVKEEDVKSEASFVLWARLAISSSGRCPVKHGMTS